MSKPAQFATSTRLPIMLHLDSICGTQLTLPVLQDGTFCAPAEEKAQLVLTHIFHLHGLPVDVVSDHGPQFSSVH